MLFNITFINYYTTIPNQHYPSCILVMTGILYSSINSKKNMMVSKTNKYNMIAYNKNVLDEQVFAEKYDTVPSH